MAFCVFSPIAITDIKSKRKKYKYFIFRTSSFVTGSILNIAYALIAPNTSYNTYLYVNACELLSN